MTPAPLLVPSVLLVDEVNSVDKAAEAFGVLVVRLYATPSSPNTAKRRLSAYSAPNDPETNCVLPVELEVNPPSVVLVLSTRV